MTRWGPPVGETRIEDRSGERVITGMAAVYHRSDDAGSEYEIMPGVKERILPGAFDRALDDSHDVRALFNHDPNTLLGRTSSGTLRLEKTKRGLRYEIPYDEHDPDHQRVKRKLERGDLTGSSMAFRVVDEEWLDHNTVRGISDVELFDVGPVTYPAYRGTSSGLRSEDLQEVRSALQSVKQIVEEQAFMEPDAPQVLETIVQRLEVLEALIKLRH